MTTDNNKRIAKNTFLLYIRMILLMGVNLFTSRIILQALGVEDYGIYNVVGGVITMLSFITGSISGAISRFITYALGENNPRELERVFGTIQVVLLFLSTVILLFGETIGLWFVWNKLVIPEARLWAAFWVYQISIITAIVSVLSIPYNTLIIAHEKMGAFAYISILEGLLKLLIAYSLIYTAADRLIVYAVLLMLVTLSIRIIYTVYCKRAFKESQAKLHLDKKLFIEIATFSGWCGLGNLAVVGYTQGLNILLNMFFGPAVNAARGIAVQVQGAAIQFGSNFLTAIHPQITKSYASGDYDSMHKLIIYSTKYAFFLMLLISCPIIINTAYILDLWLVDVPQHTVQFIRITLVIAALEYMKFPILNGIHATGNIKKVQTVEGTVLLLIVPISYLLLKLGVQSPLLVFIVYLLVECFTQAIRIYYDIT